MNTKAIGAAVTGARHQRMGRNGQDGVAAWADGDAACVVVCDGCGSGASSEVGARLGAQLFARVLAARIDTGLAAFEAARAEVVRAIGELIERMPGDRLAVMRDYFLFTVVAAATAGGETIVWAIGDGAYALDGAARVLGPFADNQPPYLAYDLVGEAREAHVARGRARTTIIATDGAAELALDIFDTPRSLAHPDALRRQLAILARTDERIDWETRRVVRVPAVLQDDCAVGILQVSA